MRHWNYYTTAIYYKSLSAMPLVEASLINYGLFSNTSVRGSKPETIVRCFVCHLISIFRFDLLQRTKRTYSHTRMCFPTSSAFSVQNVSVWEIYLCWLISRNSLQSLKPLVLYSLHYIFIKRCYAYSTVIKITYCRDGQLIWLKGQIIWEATLRRSRLADK